MVGSLRSGWVLVAALVGVDAAIAASRDDLPHPLSQSLAPQVLRTLESDPAAKRYALVARLNPFYLHGDFNGDGRTDTAVLVRERLSGKFGIAIVHAGARGAIILGAGRSFGHGGDDFDWMDAWHLHAKGPVERGAEQRSPPALKGDALMLIKTESASGLVYWNGKRYVWYQQGD